MRGDGAVTSGSGYAVGSGGQLITNEHVVHGAAQVAVILPDGRRVSAHVVRTDEGRDLALLSVSGAALPPVRFASPPALMVGQHLFALGFPQAAAPSLEPTLTSGSLMRSVVISGATFLQTDVPASIGNSGGPLLTMCGEVAGTVSSGAPQASGITFAVASQEVQAFLAGVPPLRPGGPLPTPAPTTSPAAMNTPSPTPRASPSVMPTRTPTPTRLTTPMP